MMDDDTYPQKINLQGVSGLLLEDWEIERKGIKATFFLLLSFQPAASEPLKLGLPPPSLYLLK